MQVLSKHYGTPDKRKKLHQFMKAHPVFALEFQEFKILLRIEQGKYTDRGSPKLPISPFGWKHLQEEKKAGFVSAIGSFVRKLAFSCFGCK